MKNWLHSSITGYILVLLTIIAKLEVHGRGVDLGLCDDTRFDCDCGDGSKTRIKIKQCTFFYRWKPSCKPCNKVEAKDVCPKYKQCSACQSNVDDNQGCSKCPPDLKGKWCDEKCACINGGSCEKSGACICPKNYGGTFCENILVRDCNSPISPTDGFVDFSSTKIDTIISYRCKENFRLQGVEVNKCLPSGVWQYPVPKCVSTCNLPDVTPPKLIMEFVGDQISPSKGIQAQGKVDYSYAYNPISSKEVPRKQEEARYGYGPRKQEARYGYGPSPKLQRKNFGSDEFISSIKFSCQLGYDLDGPEIIRCVNGKWSSQLPKCIKFCNRPLNPDNGLVYPDFDEYLPENSVNFKCNSGYLLVGHENVECLENGTWSLPSPRCIPEVLCPDPGTPPKTTREARAPFIPESTISFKCIDEAILVGESTISCNEDGQWNSPLPYCLKISDRMVNCTTAGSEIIGEENEPIRIQCPSGCSEDPSPIYGTVIYESSSALCKAAIHSGKITDSGGPVLIINNAKYAGFISSVIHSIASEGKREFSNSFRFSSTPPKKFSENGFTTACPFGWYESGNKCILVIEKEKAWEEARRICANLDSTLADIDLTSVRELQPLAEKGSLVDKFYWFGKLCSAVQVNKKALSIASDLPCTDYNSFLCNIRLLTKGSQCNDPGKVQFAQKVTKNSIDGLFYEGSSVSYTCGELYQLRGAKILTCQSNGEWNSPKPECHKLPICKDLDDVANGNLQYSNLLAIGRTRPGIGPVSRVVFPGRFRFGHLPISLTAPKNESLAVPVTRNFTVPNGFQKAGTKAIYTCESRFYERIGSRVRTCKENGEWSGKLPSCNPICGMSSAPRSPFIVNGNATEIGQWPWQAAVAAWWPEKDSFYTICGGSLLNEKWVLTAAHCVTYKTTKIVIPNSEFQIYLGKYHRNDTKDDDSVQVRKIDEIHVHASYDPIEYNSDIALIKLKTAVELTTRVRTICLPTFKSSTRNLVSGKYGIVTGWGMSENNEYSEELQQAKLPVVDSATCEKGYQEDGIPLTLTDNMFCAGYGAGEVDACSGDSGGPMVFRDSGTQKWTLEGIVSWGSPMGCGNPNQYGGYTRVERFLQWIQEFL